MQYVFYTGGIVGVDISSWRKEINNRLGGGITVAANIVDIVTIVITKFNPYYLAADLVFRAGGIVWHIIKKGEKAAILEAEIKTALDDQLKELLSVLWEPLKDGVLLGEADA